MKIGLLNIICGAVVWEMGLSISVVGLWHAGFYTLFPQGVGANTPWLRQGGGAFLNQGGQCQLFDENCVFNKFYRA